MILEDDGDMVCSQHSFRVGEDGVCPFCRRELIRQAIDRTTVDMKNLNARLAVLERELFQMDEKINKL